MKVLDELKRMIRLASISSQGNEEIANFTAQMMEDRGLKVQLQHVTHSFDDISKRQFNVVGIWGDTLVDRKTKKGLLLLTHLDTVGPGLFEFWNSTGGDPYAATIKDGRVHGLGTAATKLDFLSKLQAISKFREKKLKMPIYLVGTCLGEYGMLGAKYLIKSGALNPKYVLVGGPTALNLVYAHKAMQMYRVSVGYQHVERDARGFNRRIDLYSYGRSAHGSTPGSGVNAIMQLLEFVQMAQENGFELKFTKLEGGETTNKVPDRALAQFYLTSHQFEDFKRFFREAVRSRGLEKSFKVELGGLGETGVRFIPDQVILAIQSLVDFFLSQRALFEADQDPSFDPPVSTINFSQIMPRQGGLDLVFDMRLLPQLDSTVLYQGLLGEVQGIASRYPSLNIALIKDRSNPVFNSAPDTEWAQICKQAMDTPMVKGSSASEAALFAEAQTPVLIFGAGIGPNNMHSPNENISLEAMDKATLFYERVIEKVCL